jgi:hypothetical protein
MMEKKETEAMKKVWREAQKKREDDLIHCQILLETTRAGKLLLKNKPFIVVAIDEPYFPQAYRLIRSHEKRKGTWTENCEECFQEWMDQWFNFVS